MKKLFFVAIVATLLSLFSNTEAKAQQSLINNTKCDLVIAFDYGPTGSCVNTGYSFVVVPAATTIPAPMPPGNEIQAAKGTYASGGCNSFYVGLPSCTSYPLSDAVNCNAGCYDFNGVLNPSVGVIVHH